MKISVSPTEQYFRTEEGYTVRLWMGTMTTDAGCDLPVSAYIAAIAYEGDGEGLIPIPSPNAVIDSVLWHEPIAKVQ